MNKKRTLLITGVAIVGIARATVEQSIRKRVKTLVHNERVVGYDDRLDELVMVLKAGIPEINNLTIELGRRFNQGRFGRPPKKLGSPGRRVR